MASTGGPAGRTDDIAALRDLFARMVAAWDHADAAAYGDVFTEDADYIVFTGTHYRGRGKIADAHDALWARFLKGSRLHGVIDDIRFPGPDVAIVTARGAILRFRFSRRHTTRCRRWWRCGTRGRGGSPRSRTPPASGSSNGSAAGASRAWLPTPRLAACSGGGGMRRRRAAGAGRR